MSKDERLSELGSDFAEVFADFAVGLRGEDLPATVAEAARTNLFDTLACATAGPSAQGVAELAELLTDWGGKPEATVWGFGTRLPAHHAAWLNGMMAHARDFDDTHDEAVLHAGVSVIPAALAAAEMTPSATGADLLAGIVAGLELICRTGMATELNPIDAGFIYTALLGHFSATAAAARVCGLDREQTINALGIAYSQAAGTHQVTRDAAWTKRMQPGLAAKTGIVSVRLTQAGILGPRNTFEGIDGLSRTYLRDTCDPEILRQGLGREFTFLGLSYKPYPCCRFNHTGIDAALEVRDRMGPDRVGDIRRVVARVNAQCREAVGTPTKMRRAPKSIVQGQFSIPYTVSAALAKGTVGLHDFTEEGIRDARILRLAALTEVVVDPVIERDWGRRISPVHLEVHTDDAVFEARVDIPRGHTSRPMTRDTFDGKLADCLAAGRLGWEDDAVARIRHAVDTLATAPRGADLVGVLVAGNGSAR